MLLSFFIYIKSGFFDINLLKELDFDIDISFSIIIIKIR